MNFNQDNIQDPAVVEKVETYNHVNLLNERAKTRFADQAHDSTEDRDRNATLRRLSQCIHVSRAHTRSLQLSSLLEKVQKAFDIKCDDDSDNICKVQFTWEIEKNLLRRSSFDHHIATIRVNDELALSVDDTDVDGEVVSGPLECAVTALQRAAAPCSATEARWFLSFVCSYPSDVAFDVVSKPLMP